MQGVFVYFSELRQQYLPLGGRGVALYRKEHVLRPTGMKIVLHHKVQHLTKAVPDLIHKLAERDLPLHQATASLAYAKLPEPAAGVPDDKPRYYAPGNSCFIGQVFPFPGMAESRGTTPRNSSRRPYSSITLGSRLR